MTGDGGTGRSGRQYHYYTCNKRKYDHACDKERAPKDWIERLVISELSRLVNSDGFIDMIADKVVEFQERERDRSALHALEARQRENEKAIANLVAAMEAGIVTPTTKSRLVEREAERANIERGIARERVREPKLERDQIVFFLERFRNGDVEDDGYRVMLVDTFLNSVFLHDDDRLVLVLNYSGEGSKITLTAVEKAVADGGAECSSLGAFAGEQLFGACAAGAHVWGDGEVWRDNETRERIRACAACAGGVGAEGPVRAHDRGEGLGQEEVRGGRGAPDGGAAVRASEGRERARGEAVHGRPARRGGACRDGAARVIVGPGAGRGGGFFAEKSRPPLTKNIGVVSL